MWGEGAGFVISGRAAPPVPNSASGAGKQQQQPKWDAPSSFVVSGRAAPAAPNRPLVQAVEQEDEWGVEC